MWKCLRMMDEMECKDGFKVITKGEHVQCCPLR